MRELSLEEIRAVSGGYPMCRVPPGWGQEAGSGLNGFLRGWLITHGNLWP